MKIASVLIFCLAWIVLLTEDAPCQDKVRARGLGIPLQGTPGQFNAITDVEGVEVGYATIIDDKKVLGNDSPAVRTGVTAVLPRGKNGSVSQPVFAAWHSHNGHGEMTGTATIEERGVLRGPIMITNTHSVGTVHQAVIA